MGLPPLDYYTNGYTVRLYWRNVASGNPSIKIFRSCESNGGTAYLTNSLVALQQAVYSSSNYLSIGTVSSNTTFYFPASEFAGGGNFYYLFEGAAVGTGELAMDISKNGTNVVTTSVCLQLLDIKDMYERAEAVNVTSDYPPSSLVSSLHLTHTMPADPSEAKQMIIFVHGINNTPFDYECTSETMFKRLYWAGYQGRFSGFRWPCAYLPTENTWDPFQYNKGEFFAWKSGTAFKSYLNYIHSNSNRLPGYAINVIAHSQGNVVASEAIVQGAPFDSYILSQGAIPAHCYDTNAPFLAKLLEAETNTPTPFSATNGGYNAYCLTISGNVVDFYNTNDFALATGTTLGLDTNWEEDQRTQKPENVFGFLNYSYNPSTGLSTDVHYSVGTYTVTDLQEAKAMIARSRSKAVGAQGSLHGVISSSFNLNSALGFGTTRAEHSGQFNRNIQDVIGYYDQMLTSFGIQ